MKSNCLGNRKKKKERGQHPTSSLTQTRSELDGQKQNKKVEIPFL
jgi:hypothetical protein